MYSLSLQNLKTLIKWYSGVASKAVAQECVHVDEESTAALLADWTLEKMEMAAKREELRTTAKCLNRDLAADHEPFSGQGTLHSELLEAQNSSIPVESYWRSVREHFNATNRYFAKVV